MRSTSDPAALPQGRRGIGFCCFALACAGLALVLAVYAADEARADAVIAVPYPFEGPHAVVGRRIALAVEQAARDLNARGGVTGEKVVVRRIDDGCNGAAAAAASTAVVAERPALIVGHPCAGGAIAAARVYSAVKLLFIATETRHKALTDSHAGPTILRLAGRDDAQGTFAGHYLAKSYPGRRIAVVSDRTAYARSISERAVKALAAAGAEPVLLTIVAGEKDFGALVARIRDWQCAAILFAGFPIEAASILRQLRAAGLATPLLGTEVMANDDLAAAAGSAAELARALSPTDPARRIAASSGGEVSGRDSSIPDGATLRARAAVELWAAAAQEKSTLVPDAVAAALKTGAHESVLGRVAFNARGDAELPAYDVLEWRGSRWVAVTD